MFKLPVLHSVVACPEALTATHATLVDSIMFFFLGGIDRRAWILDSLF